MINTPEESRFDDLLVPRRLTPAGRWSSLGLAVLAVVISLVRYVPEVDEPWDDSLASINGGVYMGRMVRNWQRFGFRELRGMPSLAVAPIVNRPAATPYLNHPPFYPWAILSVVELVGYRELGFRLLPLVFAALTGGLLTHAMARRVGGRAALFLAALWAMTPMSWLFGYMPNPESAALFFIVATLLLHDRARRGGSRWWWVATFVCFFLGTLTDWQAYFVAPGIWLRELLSPRDGRRFSKSLWLFPIGVASFCGSFGLFAWWLGGVGAAFSGVTGAATTSATASAGFTVVEWIRSQVVMGARFFGPVAVLALLGAPVVLAWSFRRDGGGARLLLAALVPAVLNVGFFRRHAYDHHFWWYYALPYALAVTGWAVMRLRSPGLRGGVALVILGTLAFQSVREFRNFENPLWREAAVRINERVGAGDLLVATDEPGRETFWIDAHVWHAAGGPAELRAIVALWRQGQLAGERLFVVVPSANGAACDVLRRAEPAAVVREPVHTLFRF